MKFDRKFDNLNRIDHCENGNIRGTKKNLIKRRGTKNSILVQSETFGSGLIVFLLKFHAKTKKSLSKLV